MNQVTPKVEATPNIPSHISSLPKPTTQNSYARMSNRRAIACTICAKAKTKCDKAVPSCSRCTAKGLPCEPRSTRRTSDSNYRATAKKLVSPKHFRSSSAIPPLSRHGSPRSVPTSNRHQLVRAMSQMDMAAASKLHQQPNLPGMPMYPTLQGYTPQIVDEYYSDYSSPEPNMGIFAPQTKTTFFNNGRLTPQTPESFTYNESMPIGDSFDQYPQSQPWSEDGNVPIGLGFESDMPGMMLTDPELRMWGTPELENPATTMSTAQSFDTPLSQSPTSMSAWPHQSLSVSPPQHPHTRAVPSLSISESSAPDFDSSDGTADEWNNYPIDNNTMVMAKPRSSAMFMDTIKIHPKHPQWEDVILPRSSTF